MRRLNGLYINRILHALHIFFLFDFFCFCLSFSLVVHTELKHNSLFFWFHVISQRMVSNDRQVEVLHTICILIYVYNFI